MALMITDDCINCALCEPECPNMAIFEGEDIFEIDPSRCTECIGHFEKPQCQMICPVDCIPIDELRLESRDELQLKYEQLTGKAVC